MAKKNENGYLSAKESRRISRENRKITDQFEKLHKRKNVPEEEFLTKMHDENNSLEIENLHTYFFSDVGTVRAVDGVSFDVPIGKTVGVVGESGCGKSVTSLSIMQLLQRPQGQIVEGEIRLNLGNGKAYDITKTPIEQMQKLRGNYMSMIFQEPMTALNPVFRIGEQVDEITKLHNPDMSKEQVKARTIEMLKLVGIANSEGVYKMYPHELSGGQLQRVAIARAISIQPKLLICDEATGALDVSIQNQIAQLLVKLVEEKNIGCLFIGHDLALVRSVSQRIAVMYLGRIVELLESENLGEKAMHPYTKMLLGSIFDVYCDQNEEIAAPKGEPPSPLKIRKGCAFAERCSWCSEKCKENVPPLQEVEPGHKVACFQFTE